MGLVMFEGFDYANQWADLLPKWINISPGAGSFVTGRVGSGQAMNIFSGGWRASAFTEDPGTTNALIIGFAMEKTGSTLSDILRFYDGTSEMLAIEYQTDNKLKVIRFSTSILESTIAIPQDEWHYLEIKVLFHQSAGSVEFRIDGVAAGSVSGIDTINFGASCDRVEWRGASSNSLHLDDVYIGNTAGGFDFLGPVFVATVRPTSDDAVQFTRSGGSANYEMVDDTFPDEDTTVNESDTSAQQDTFGFGALGISADAVVHAVGVSAFITKPEPGPVGVNLVTKTGSTDVGAEKRLVNGGYARLVEMHLVDPHDAAAWTPAGIDAANFGYKRA